MDFISNIILPYQSHDTNCFFQLSMVSTDPYPDPSSRFNSFKFDRVEIPLCTSSKYSFFNIARAILKLVNH